MQAQTIPQNIYREFLEQRGINQLPPISYEEFTRELLKQYKKFQLGTISLGYAAEQLGIGKGQMIDLLDMLGWKITNI